MTDSTQQQVWSDERIKERADEIDVEMYNLHGGNTRPWQHYMQVWQQITYEIRDDLQAQLAALDTQGAGWESVEETTYTTSEGNRLTISISNDEYIITISNRATDEQQSASFPHHAVRLCRRTATPQPAAQDDNGGRRWWRMSRDGESQPWCINIAEMEWFWLRGWRPEYPLQAQPLDTPQPAPEANDEQ